jgi:hypothetical protein
LVLLEVATEPFSWFWIDLRKNPVLVKELEFSAEELWLLQLLQLLQQRSPRLL